MCQLHPKMVSQGFLKMVVAESARFNSSDIKPEGTVSCTVFQNWPVWLCDVVLGGGMNTNTDLR